MGIIDTGLYFEILFCSYRGILPNRYRSVILRNRHADRSVNPGICSGGGFYDRIYNRLDIKYVSCIRFYLCRTVFRLHRALNIDSCIYITASIYNAEASVMYGSRWIILLAYHIAGIIFTGPFGIFFLIIQTCFRFRLSRQKIAHLTAGRNGKSRRQNRISVIVCFPRIYIGARGRYHSRTPDVNLGVRCHKTVHNVYTQQITGFFEPVIMLVKLINIFNISGDVAPLAGIVQAVILIICRCVNRYGLACNLTSNVYCSRYPGNLAQGVANRT